MRYSNICLRSFSRHFQRSNSFTEKNNVKKSKINKRKINGSEVKENGAIYYYLLIIILYIKISKRKWESGKLATEDFR